MRRGTKSLQFRSLTRLAGVVALALGGSAGCYDFHKTGPSAPDPIPLPATVSVSVEYVQPNGCIAPARCGDLVVFFGSWMPAGGEIQLTRDPLSHIWTGVVTGVPVNFPPGGDPYQIRVYDPFLQDGPTVRYTGQRVTFGGQALSHVQTEGAHDEAALAYVDSNGFGHNPF